MRYGHENLDHVYRSLLKNCKEKRDKALQEHEVDIARIVRFAYPSAPKNKIKCLAFNAFVDRLLVVPMK